MDTIDTILPTLHPSSNYKCDRYYTAKNTTHFIYGGYEGIPENLLLNIIGWVVLLVLFSLLRKIAWDYGRIALVSRTEARWTSLFYGDHMSQLSASQESLDLQVHRQDKGFCSWIPAFFRIKDEHILQKSGRDAVQYLSFQRYLLVYLSVVTVFCIAIVLPVNFQGDLEGNTQTFGHTTISNIDSNSPTLWIHSILAVVFLIIAVFFMRHFSINLQYEEDEHATRTLMVSNIPRERCYKNSIIQHFQEAYPEAPVQDIQFAYNIAYLVRLDKARQRAFEGLVHSEILYKQSGERPAVIPYPCGQCCFLCCNEVDAIDYYTQDVAILKEKCEIEKINAFRDALGIAFITFEEDVIATRVHADFKVSCKGAHNPHPSSVSRELGVHNWECKYAPSPDNINWGNLSVSLPLWWLKAFVLNLIVLILLFFLTTPSIFMNLLNQGSFHKTMADLHDPVLVQFIPTLLLWAIAALLPNIVYYTDQWIGHWTRTAEHHAVMRKTFFFLLLMVLILPSLGLTSAKAFFEWMASQNEDAFKFRWKCIYIPDNGAFFVNYVITSAIIGTAAELIRFPELFMYSMKLMVAKSAAERSSVRKSVIYDFQYGCQYAWTLCVFAVVMAYSLTCPLITPFGLLYLVMKHMVDRYNIYFAYGPSKIDKNIHASAVNFVIMAVILLQCAIVFFTVLRAEQLQGITIFSIIALFVTLIIFFGRICFGWFKGLSPIAYKQHLSESEVELNLPMSSDSKPFIPGVLLPEDRMGDADADEYSNVGGSSISSNPSGSRYGTLNTSSGLSASTGTDGRESQSTLATNLSGTTQ